MLAPCKINIFLEIVGKRDDGYHEIRTIFMPLDAPFDEIMLDKAEKGIKIECDDENLPIDDKNICWRAAKKFADACGIDASWKISIKKRIPVAAGLGGGSSDAATVLKILDQLYPGRCDIRKIAVSLGADVSYFLNPVPSLGAGIGECLSPLKSNPRLPVLIINPVFPVSSAWSYQNFKRSATPIKIGSMLKAIENGDLAQISESLRNDLAPALYFKFPLLGMIRESILKLGALNAEISGSGPTLFAIFPDDKYLEQVSIDLKKKYPIIRIFNGING